MPLVDAPEGFQAKLRALDPTLSARLVNVKVNKLGDRDWRWALFWTSPNSGRSYQVYLVEEAREPLELVGAFRPLDDRVILDLKRLDAWNRGDKKIMDEIVAVEEGMVNAIDKDTEELCRGMSKHFRRLFAGNILVQVGWTAPR